MNRIIVLLLVALAAAVIMHTGCGTSGASGAGGNSGDSAGTNSISGTVQAPTIGIFGSVSKSVGHKAATSTGVANATVCAYNLVTGTKLGCATSDSSGNYTISNLSETNEVDPNSTSRMRVVIEATTSDGQAVIYDYEDTAYTATLSAGTANADTTNAFLIGTLSQIRKIDGSWKVGAGLPQGFIDKLTGNTFDPACEFAPIAAMLADNDVTATGSGVAGSVGLVASMLDAAMGHAVWKTLAFDTPADFTYAALNNQLTDAQLSAWASAVAEDVGVAAETLISSYASAASVMSTIDSIYGSVLASDVGLESRSGRDKTLCERFKSDSTTLANWVDTVIKYDDTDALGKHWGSETAFSAAAKFIEEFDDNDVWSSYQPYVMIGLLGTDFSGEELTDARIAVGADIFSKGSYSDLDTAGMEDVGEGLWKMLFSADSTELDTMDDNPAFWVGYVMTYHSNMTDSYDYGKLIDLVMDNADDVDKTTCESDPKACVTTAGAETPAESVLSNISGNFAVTFGSASGNTCYYTAVSCAAGTGSAGQSSGSNSLACSYSPSDSSTHLTGTGSVSGTTSWSCTVSRSTSYSGCDVTESYAFSGAPNPLTANDTTVTLTRASSASSICDYVVGSGNSCSFSCSTTLATQ